MPSNVPPGPRRLPVVGNDCSVDRVKIYKNLLNHKELYGDISSVYFPGRLVISLNTLDIAIDVLGRGENARILSDRPDAFISKYILPEDVSTEKWTADWFERRCAVVSVHQPSLPENRIIKEAIFNEMECFISCLNAVSTGFFNPRELCRLSTTNVIIISLIGRRFGYSHEIFEFYKQFSDAAGKLSVMHILDVMPFLRHLPFYWGKQYRSLENARRGMVKYLLDDVKQESDDKIAYYPGVVYEMLRSQRAHSSIKDINIAGYIADSHISGELVACESLLHILYQLLYRSDVQTKISNEIDQIGGRSKVITLDNRSKMPFTEAVIIESLRHSSMIPTSVPRSNQEDFHILGYAIPKDTVFLTNMWWIHHDPAVWKNPWSFNPERFLDYNGALRVELIEKIIPFGIGKRFCTGEHYIRSALFLYVANIIQNFEIYNDDESALPQVDPREFPFDQIVRVPDFKIKLRKRN